MMISPWGCAKKASGFSAHARMSRAARSKVASSATPAASASWTKRGAVSRSAQLPVPGGELALTYQDIWTLKDLPQEVTVIGGADTGCQIASIFADLGAHVRLIEAGPRLVPIWTTSPHLLRLR